MRIDYLSLKNYRQYREQKIELGVSGEKRVVVIQGSMGSGKTNILNAITWCLYGKEPHIGMKSRALPLVNTLALTETREGKLCSVEVEVQFSREDTQYRVKRTALFKKGADGAPIAQNTGYESDGSKLEVWANLGKDVGYFRDPSLIIQRLIPEDIYEYFFFDGEKLDQYFKEEAAQRIKEAVFKISQLELLDRIIDHLDDSKHTMLKKSKALSPKSEDILSRIELETSTLKEYRELLERHLAEKRKGDDAQRDLEQKLLNAKVPDVKEKRAELSSREKVVQSRKDTLLELEDDLRRLLVGHAPQVLAISAIQKTFTIIGEEKDAGELPPDIKRIFLENLLKKGVCICGEDIASSSGEHRKRVEAFMSKCDEITNISEELFDLHRTLGSIKSGVSSLPRKYVELGKGINSTLADITENSEKIKLLEEKIKGAGNEDVTHWQEQVEWYKSELAEINGQIALDRDQIARLEASIKMHQAELDEELGKEKRLKALSDQLAFCDNALVIANKVKTEIMSETRTAIEERTRKQFKSLLVKKQTYTDLQIDDEYNISLRDQSGLPAIGSLSAGERQVLALSFIESLSSISGFDAPIIIDTPLGRISEEPTQNIARGLPGYFDGKQLVLLVTEKEYSPEVRGHLASAVFREYRIKFMESRSGNKAEVVPYGK